MAGYDYAKSKAPKIEDIAIIANRYWKFDKYGRPTSTKIDKGAFMEALKELYEPTPPAGLKEE